MADELWTIQKLLVWTTGFFTRKGIDAPRRTAEILLSHVLGMDRVRLYMEFERPLDEAERARFKALVQRRAAREPTDYLTGSRPFHKYVFAVDARVLVPRPETEQLVETALSRLPKPGRGDADAPRVLDLCTGSGCVGLTIAAERPDACVTLTDISADALDVARANAQQLGVSGRTVLLQGDLFAPVSPNARFDIVVSNPPYVRRGVIPTLEPEVQKEPVLALDGGDDGLDLIRRIIAKAPQHLRPGGWLCLEIGDEQGREVLALLQGAGFRNAAVSQDFAGLDRIASGRLPS